MPPGDYAALAAAAIALVVFVVAVARRWTAVAFAAVLALAIAHSLLFRSVSDDSYITYRYASNVAEGFGAVYNPGMPPIEGYSNFLWMIVLAGFAAVGIAPTIAAPALGTAFFLATVVLAYCVARWINARLESRTHQRYMVGAALQPRPSISLTVALLVAASGPLAAYAMTGMETTLFAFLLLATLAAAISGRAAVAGLLAALATMTRPEGVLLVPIITTWFVLHHTGGDGRCDSPVAWGGIDTDAGEHKVRPYNASVDASEGEVDPNARGVGGCDSPVACGAENRIDSGTAGRAPTPASGRSDARPDTSTKSTLTHTCVLFLAAYVLLIAPWTAWRVEYYCHLVPNALAAKRGMDLACQVIAGTRYAGKLFLAPFFIPFVVLGAWGILRAARDRFRAFDPAILLLLATLAAYGAFTVAVGGDWMPAWRFLAPLFPIAMFTLALLWREEIARYAPRRVGAVAVACLAIVLVAGSAWHARMLPEMRRRHDETMRYAALGKWLGTALPPGTVVATPDAGALAYHAELPIVDMLGLTDLHIAREGLRERCAAPGHVAHDWRYVLDRRPAMIFVTGRDTRAVVAPWDATAVGAGEFADPELRRRFEREYAPVAFVFDTRSPIAGQGASAFLRRDDASRLRALLVRDGTARVVAAP